MTKLQDFLKMTWPSLTVSAAVTAKGVAALTRQTATKTKGVALAAIGAYMLMNHILAYYSTASKKLEEMLEGFRNSSLTKKIELLAIISFTPIPVAALGLL